MKLRSSATKTGVRTRTQLAGNAFFLLTFLQTHFDRFETSFSLFQPMKFERLHKKFGNDNVNFFYFIVASPPSQFIFNLHIRWHRVCWMVFLHKQYLGITSPSSTLFLDAKTRRSMCLLCLDSAPRLRAIWIAASLSW